MRGCVLRELRRRGRWQSKRTRAGAPSFFPCLRVGKKLLHKVRGSLRNLLRCACSLDDGALRGALAAVVSVACLSLEEHLLVVWLCVAVRALVRVAVGDELRLRAGVQQGAARGGGHAAGRVEDRGREDANLAVLRAEALHVVADEAQLLGRGLRGVRRVLPFKMVIEGVPDAAAGTEHVRRVLAHKVVVPTALPVQGLAAADVVHDACHRERVVTRREKLWCEDARGENLVDQRLLLRRPPGSVRLLRKLVNVLPDPRLAAQEQPGSQRKQHPSEPADDSVHCSLLNIPPPPVFAGEHKVVGTVLQNNRPIVTQSKKGGWV
eukprot:Rhum_TRINITY_DN7898_c0_g1::Rhum_TRINITY_DN7898_c0_g1_i1::g.24781::m.24781